MLSNSSNITHQNWGPLFSQPLYYRDRQKDVAAYEATARQSHEENYRNLAPTFWPSPVFQNLERRKAGNGRISHVLNFRCRGGITAKMSSVGTSVTGRGRNCICCNSLNFTFKPKNNSSRRQQKLSTNTAWSKKVPVKFGEGSSVMNCDVIGNLTLVGALVL